MSDLTITGMTEGINPDEVGRALTAVSEAGQRANEATTDLIDTLRSLRPGLPDDDGTHTGEA